MRVQQLQIKADSFILYKIFLFTLFFLSGATSLSLEVAWSKELSYLLGVDIYAATTVVTAFMAGLGLGAILVARFYHWSKVSIKSYGIIQLIIGICGLVSIPLFRSAAPIFEFIYTKLNYDTTLFLMARFLVVFALMLIPVTLMGMTLPLVVGASFKKIMDKFASLTGLLYGINTVGAVGGTLTAGFLLIPKIGILRTCLLTGLVDLLIGIVVLWFVKFKEKNLAQNKKPLTRQRVKPDPRLSSAGKPGTLINHFYNWPIAILVLSGMAALAYEIIWFRLLARIIGPTVHAFSIMLATYLVGIGFGSIMGSHWVKRTPNHRLAMAILLIIIGTGPLVSLIFVNHLPLWYGRLFVIFSKDMFTLWNPVIQGTIASLLILPATLPLGALFPFAVQAYHIEAFKLDSRIETSVGKLYFFNTLGGVIGCLFTGFWLLPAIGIKLSIISAGGLLIVLSIIIFLTAMSGSQMRKSSYASALLGIITVIALNVPKLDQDVLNAGIYSEMLNKERFEKEIDSEKSSWGNLLFFQEGINNSVAVVGNKLGDGNLTLHLNGEWESSTQFHARLHLQFLAHLPMLFAHQHQTIGVIGYGAGITTGTILLYPGVKRVNVFELEPGVIKADKYFNHINHNPLKDSRTHLFMVDGRSHITHDNFRYDVFTADPIHPVVAGAGNLYTLDFYKIVRKRLNPGGIFCQWIPLVGISPATYKTILKTIHDIFPHMALFSFFGESVVLASEQPLRVDWEKFKERFYTPPVFRDFNFNYIESPFNLIAFYLGGEQQMDALLQDIHLANTDDNVWLEHQMPIDLYDLSHGNLYFMLREKIQQDNGASLRQIFPGMPMERLAEELAALSLDGDRYYKMAVEAKQKEDFTAMEKYYRIAFSDVNSKFYNTAGIELARHLTSQHRFEEAHSILNILQKNFPAFPEAYYMDAGVYIQEGNLQEANNVLNRGLMYNPNDSNLLEFRKKYFRNGSKS